MTHETYICAECEALANAIELLITAGASRLRETVNFPTLMEIMGTTADEATQAELDAAAQVLGLLEGKPGYLESIAHLLYSRDQQVARKDLLYKHPKKEV